MNKSWSMLPLTDDTTPNQLPSDAGAALASLSDIASLLRSPIARARLSREAAAFTDSSGTVYPIIDGRPILYPAAVLKHIHDGELSIPVEATYRDALCQYLYLGQVKAKGWSSNSAPDDPWFLRHVWRSRDLFESASGLMLDIGCDDPSMSRRAYPSDVTYVGLEPTLHSLPTFSVAGLAEFLPFADGVFDGASMMTSLDHILDYHAAIDEAHRVLKPGGVLYLASLVWTDEAELSRDNIHFHHFREFEIVGALQNFEISYAKRYNWKDNPHRYGVYIRAKKAS